MKKGYVEIHTSRADVLEAMGRLSQDPIEFDYSFFENCDRVDAFIKEGKKIIEEKVGFPTAGPEGKVYILVAIPK